MAGDDRTMEEVELNISDLHPMTEPKAINELAAILENEEIVHPIVVLLVDKNIWAEQKKKVPFIFDPPEIEGVIMQIRCGHNRVEWLKRQGKTTVRALIYIDEGLSSEKCKEQNKWQKQKHKPLI